ncbi:NrfD/PsrC family molybdoenzyme membrane anchor subunit [Natrialbaceae archaeon AArc-T1-2]|uniref:NrfD/PsrC family molybdoenzyme membrane anchor subunit n=1 Tax=Natrialbaceae archaeon AArc-T1-2 TaxID=3053904 RepID=UPI00255A90A2|nr:NrfD/PsrC family molybdoenzyme membrane anchor subunit [Natrialbaceae archaeon AArc-T1-2]WIV66742.1 polysulfide reductase NrfD [Natrialbaceae archaeon AArc-T1-2]
MSTKKPTADDILRPIKHTSKRYYALFILAAAAFGAFSVGWGIQLSEGMVVTGLSDWGSGGGVTWGLYIGAFIWWVGIAHGGIILSAAVRLLGMDRYMPVARLAEMLTLAGLSAAGLYIVVHVGRPDRIVTSVIPAYLTTVQTSPLVWDMTVITLYFVMTATYLFLTLRYDVTRLRDQLPNHFEPIYKIITIGYTKKEDEIIERMVWWLAAAIIILAPLLLHGGVIPWLFALLPSMPGWFSAVQGPQFLTIALTSAISGVIIASYAFRRSYGWEHIITDDIFRGLTLWLGFFSLLFIWLQLQQVISGTFHPTTDHAQVTEAMIMHPVYQFAIVTVFIVLVYTFVQGIRPSVFSIRRSLVAAVGVLTATLWEKILFVVEGLMYPTFDLYTAVPGEYFPSLIEMVSVLGTIGLVTLIFMIFAKIVPVVELHAIEHLQEHEDEHAHETEVTAE